VRTTQRDQGRTTFAGFFDGTVASGSGVAGDVPYTFLRTATGDYTIRFDVAILPLSCVVGSTSGWAAPISWGPGTARMQSYSGAGVANNTQITFSVSGKRT
jgi:hypothetical protein